MIDKAIISIERIHVCACASWKAAMSIGRALAYSLIFVWPIAIGQACASSASSLTVHHGPNSQDSLRHSLEAISARHHLTKAWLYVGHNGSKVANVAFDADPNTPIAVASISKSITAIAIAQLIQSGRISLSSRLGDLLAETYAQHGRIMDPHTADITIAELLSHTAGLRPNRITDPEGGVSTGDIFAKLSDHPTQFDFLDASDADRSQDAGNFKYSNYSYFMLGFVIESVTKQSYESYCHTHIFKPIGIADASLIDGKFAAVPSYTGWILTTSDVATVWQDAFDVRRPVLLKASTLRATLFADFGASLGAHKDVRYTLGAWIREGTSITSPYRLWHNGIQLDYYSYVEDTVPGSIWVFASQPIPSSEKERAQVNAEVRNALKSAGLSE